MLITNESQSSQEISGGQGMFCIPDLEARIAVAAYYKAERRFFAPGHDVDDWLEAEQEVLMHEGILHCTKAAIHETSIAA
jgi:Protein of unknown function (DUF2934)